MTVATPVGFAPVFQGWNVWDLWQADDPDQSVLGAIWHAGESQERLLRVWVEDQLRDTAPGVSVADPLNPAALSGDPVQPIPKVTTLELAVSRAAIPELAGALQLGTDASKATLRTVRFFNRGSASMLPWPHDKNFVLDSVYLPSSSNPVTNAAPPTTLGGAASDAAQSIGEGLKVLGWGVGIGLVLLVVAKLGKGR